MLPWRDADIDDELASVVVKVIVVDAEIQPSADWGRERAAPAEEDRTVVVDARDQTPRRAD